MAVSLPAYQSRLVQYTYVYAVISRRAGGLSLGINLNPDKICNFDCPYCQIDRTTPGRGDGVDAEQVLTEVRDLAGRARSGALFADPALPRLYQGGASPADPALRRLRDVAFAGDGEPTTSRAFLPVVKGLVALRGSELPPDCHLTLITNASMLHRASVQEALAILDQHGGRVWAKLDAGTEPFYRRMNKTDVPYRRILTNLLRCGRQRLLTIQSMFHTIDGAPPPGEEIAALGERLRELVAGGAQIREVQVYTLARQPADATLQPLSASELEGIAERLRQAGAPAQVYL